MIWLWPYITHSRVIGYKEWFYYLLTKYCRAYCSKSDLFWRTSCFKFDYQVIYNKGEQNVLLSLDPITIMRGLYICELFTDNFTWLQEGKRNEFLFNTSTKTQFYIDDNATVYQVTYKIQWITEVRQWSLPTS